MSATDDKTERNPPANTVVDEETGERWFVDAATGERTRRWHPSSWIKVDFVRQECADVRAAAEREDASAAAREEWEKLAYVASWTEEPFVEKYHAYPNWRTLLNNSGLKKEVAEAGAVIRQVETLVETLCGGDYSRAVVFDVCCGKGYLGTTLAAKHPDLQVRLTDRNGKINFSYLRELPNAAPTIGNILKPGDWLAKYIRAELHDAEDIRRGRPSRLHPAADGKGSDQKQPMTRRQLRGIEFMKRRGEWRAAREAAREAGTEFVPPSFPSLHSTVKERLNEQPKSSLETVLRDVEAGVSAERDDDDDGDEKREPMFAIITGIHLCGLLSEKLVEVFNTEDCVKGLVLSPCCLASSKISDTAARSHKLMSSGVSDNYVYWALTLFHMVRRDCRKTMLEDPRMLTKKNRVIVAQKQHAIVFDETGKTKQLPLYTSPPPTAAADREQD